VIVTNRLDLPAELIAEIYRQRWVIEMFVRLFKHILGCRHLVSDKHNGSEHVTAGEPMRVAAAIRQSPCRTRLPGGPSVFPAEAGQGFAAMDAHIG